MVLVLKIKNETWLAYDVDDDCDDGEIFVVLCVTSVQ